MMTTAQATSAYLNRKISTADLLDIAAANVSAQYFMCPCCGRRKPRDESYMDKNGNPTICESCQTKVNKEEEQAAEDAADHAADMRRNPRNYLPD